MLALLPLTLLLACGDKDDGDGGTASGTDGGTTTTDGGGTTTDGGTTAPVDADGDGWAEDEDCDDGNADIHPGAAEVCNDGVDDDCDGDADDADDDLDTSTAGTWYLDGDEDGYGGDDPVRACVQPAGTVTEGGDCDDADPAFHPGASEEDCADPSDYNCDGSVGYADADGDGYAACEECDDGNADVNPGAREVCDLANTDEDCDGLADDEDPSVATTGLTSWYPDDDGDGFGDERATRTLACDQPTGMVADGTDCDDGDRTINPLGSEVCDEADADEDCDGLADDEDGSVATSTFSTWYTDADRDGYGDADDAGTRACDPTPAQAAVATDCDDGDAAVHPGATEVCDEDDTDEDCSGAADDADPGVSAASLGTWYADDDGDGFGDDDDSLSRCDQPDGYVAEDGDCDDGRDDVHPDAEEICDTADTDEDCNGRADDDDAGVTAGTRSTWYADTDGDGFGDRTEATVACDQPEDHVAVGTDCDDSRADVNPAATEVCDGADTDEDCDGRADDEDGSVDSGTFATFYLDGDGDGYGIAESTLTACDAPDGYAARAGDCRNDDSSIHPGASELDDLVDNDCDDLCDEDFLDVGDLVINEFMPNPNAVADSAGEWLEIANVSDRDVRFCGGWVLEDAGTDDHELDGSFTLSAGDYLVLGRSTDGAVNGGVPVTYAYGSDFSLANGDDEIILRFDGEVIDQVVYDLAGDWADAYDSGASLQLSPIRLNATSNDDPDAWCTATESYGDGDLGTPGAANESSCTTCRDVSYTLYAEADTNVNYDAGTGLSPGPDLVAYTDSGYDVGAWVRFDLDGLPSSAIVTAATLWLHGYSGYGSPSGSPAVDIVHSADDGWTDRPVTSSSELARGDTVSASTRTSFTATDYNEFTLDVDAWDWATDLSDGAVTLGADEVSGCSLCYVYFHGTTSGYEATLDLEVCE